MNEIAANTSSQPIQAKYSPIRWLSWVGVLVAIITFWVSIDAMSTSLRLLGNDALEDIIKTTSKPLSGLFIGILLTALIQSSSTTTSIIVAVVAAGSMAIEQAVPLVMGANIGTTLTSILVSMGFVSKKKEFKRAFATANLHLFFNVITLLMLFPLEVYFQLVSKICTYFTHLLFSSLPVSPKVFSNLINYAIHPIADFLVRVFPNYYIALVVFVLLLFVCLYCLSWLLRKGIGDNIQHKIIDHVFGKLTHSVAWGTIITASVQSSSIVTATLVPLVAVHRISVKKAFPFIIGANVGTTITALIAAFYHSEVALSIAFVHLFFNIVGALFFLTIGFLRNFMIEKLRQFGGFAERYISTAFIFPLIIFFILPLIALFFLQQ
jgi:sodium-dependent phosphate cotransporter